MFIKRVSFDNSSNGLLIPAGVPQGIAKRSVYQISGLKPMFLTQDEDAQPHTVCSWDDEAVGFRRNAACGDVLRLSLLSNAAQ